MAEATSTNLLPWILLLIMAVGFFVVLYFLRKEQNKREEKEAVVETLEGQIRDLVEGKARAGANPLPEKPEKKPGETLMQGLVEKRALVSAGRSFTNYTLTERMPQFTTIEAAVGFGQGICTQVEDPSKINLAGYGVMMGIDNYVALKMVLGNLFCQIENLHKATTASTETPAASPETEK